MSPTTARRAKALARVLMVLALALFLVDLFGWIGLRETWDAAHPASRLYFVAALVLLSRLLIEISGDDDEPAADSAADRPSTEPATDPTVQPEQRDAA